MDAATARTGSAAIRRSGYMRLLDYLKRLRVSAGISQSYLSIRLGRHQTFVSKYEKGRQVLTVPELMVVLEALSANAQEVANLVCFLSPTLPAHVPPPLKRARRYPWSD